MARVNLYCYSETMFDKDNNKIVIIGEIKLNSVGGAKYSGYWKDNKKHGYGVIIGNANVLQNQDTCSKDTYC